jgi:hypothetical protein
VVCSARANAIGAGRRAGVGFPLRGPQGGSGIPTSRTAAGREWDSHFEDGRRAGVGFPLRGPQCGSGIPTSRTEGGSGIPTYFKDGDAELPVARGKVFLIAAHLCNK